jgi:methyl-accepting chemotaxis protein
MKKWTISMRITLGFALLALLAACISVSGYVAMHVIEGKSGILINNCIPGSNASGAIKDLIAQQYGLLERLTRADDPAEKARIMEELLAIRTEATDLFAQYEKTIISPKNKELYADLLTTRADYIAAQQKLFALIDAGQREQSYAYLNGEFMPLYRAYRADLDKCVAFNRQRSNEIGADIAETIRSSMSFILFVLIGGMLLAVVSSWFIISRINSTLKNAISMIDNGSAQVAAAATQVAASSNSLAEGASEQAASLEETSASLEQMSSMTNRNASSAQEAKGLADSMSASADSSADQMRQMQQAMDAIKESSAGISQIIKTIDEIAFQTNILALNAAVEAARAGEAGAGFAVVAEEVRNLAQRSAESAKETSSKIEGAIRNSERGVDISARVATSLGDIVEKSREINMLVAEIAQASAEQSHGITQLTSAVQQMDKVTQTNASNAEETASAAEEMNGNAESLKDTVADLMELIRRSGREVVMRETPAGLRVSTRDVRTAPKVVQQKDLPTKENRPALTTAASSKGRFLPQMGK